MTFTCLPTSLSCTILRDWLTLKSVMALNSAYCCKSLRTMFLNVLQSNEFYIKATVVFNYGASMSSVLSKVGQKLRSVSFERGSGSSDKNCVEDWCNNLNLLHIPSVKYCTPELWRLIDDNPNLECVSLITPRIHYSGPPSTFLSLEDTQSTQFFAFIDKVFMGDEHIIEALKITGNIVRLNLYRTRVRHSTLLQLSQLCPHLIALGLMDTNLTDPTLLNITISCSGIEHLDIANNDISDDGILGMVQNLKGVRSLNLDNVRHLTDASLVHLYTHCASTLHTIHMAFVECKLPSIGEFLQRCTKLRTFNVYVDYYDIGLGKMFQPSTLSRLTTLVLKGEAFQNADLSNIGKYAANLEVLSLSYFSRDTWMSLFQGCPKLKKLFINVGVDDERLEQHEQVRELALFALDVWKELRPSGSIIHTRSDCCEYDVMTIQH